MDFRRIEIFVEVVKKGTFSRAAESLFLAQPTVSSHMAHLEKEVGSPLFERRGRKVVLTPAGEKFFPFAQDIINLKEKTLEQLAKFQTDAKGRIELASSSTPGNYLLPRVLKNFNKENPNINFSLNITQSHKAREMVRNYECDLGITGEGELGKELDQFCFYQDKMVGIVPQGHKWEGEKIRIEDLKKEPLIIPKPGSATREIFCNELKTKGYSMEDFFCYLEVNSLEGIKNHVREGLGFGFVSGVAVKDGEGLGTFFLSELDFIRKFFVVYNRRRVFPAWVDSFLAFLRKGEFSIV